MPQPSAGQDGIRRRNLASLLTRLHREGAATRAQLTAETGLNRSTIGVLVAELEALGLAREAPAPALGRVGRPSPVVSVDPRPAVIAINPEVDAITAAAVGFGARVDHRRRRETDHPLTPDEAVTVIAELVAELRETVEPSRRVLGVGLAVPGLVRASDGVVRWAPHLGWREVALTARIAHATGLPARADNDASLGARAESLFGVGRGVDELVYVNGGASGIGGGVIVRGAPLGGAHGYAGEFGHNRPGVAEAADRATVDGALEDEVSRARLLASLGAQGLDEHALHAAVLGAADRAALAEIGRQQRVLAVALANAINVLNPELVVLGGFLAALRERDPAGFDALVERATLGIAWEGVRIRPAALAEDRLLIGAAEHAFGTVLAEPDSLES